MGFLEKLFASLFGSKKSSKSRKASSNQISFEEVNQFLEQKAAEQKATSLDKEIPAKFAEIKHTIRETSELLAELEKEEITEEGNQRFRKAVKTAKGDAIKKIKAVLERIQPPFTDDLEEIRNYSNESLELLDKKIRASSKNIAYTSFLLKDSMREIGKRMDSLETSLKELSEIVKRNDFLFQKKSLEAFIASIKKEKAELSMTEEKITALEKTLEAIEKNKKSVKAALERTMNSGSARELQALESKKKELLLEKTKLREKFLETVLCMERPLKKLANLSEKGLFSLGSDSETTLSLFFRDPALLYKRDTKGESFKRLLKSLKEAIEKGKIELSEKEKAKTLASIEELLERDFFSDFFWKENSLEKALRETEAREKAISVKTEIDTAKKQLESLERNYRETLATLTETRKTAEALNKKIFESMKSLEATLSSLTGKKIEILEAQPLAPKNPALQESD
ncbi:MAG: hypothetical protein QXK06_00790 [Candidatus Diapherotrites archaeon]